MAGKRNYNDLKYKFIRGLQRQESFQRTKHWLKSAAEWSSRAIVSLELCERPIKSVKQAEKLEGIGAEIKKKLEKIKDDDYTNEKPPSAGKMVSSAAAILVAILEATELAYSEGHSKESSVLVPEEVVKNRAKTMCEETFLDITDEENHTGICPAWWRMEVLIKRGLIKRRILNKSPVYVLLPEGMEEAIKLRERSGRLPVSSNVDIPWRAENDNNVLYTNYDGADGVVLLVDMSEMGGERGKLGELCRMIEEVNIKYKTKKLKVGDYSWGWYSEGTERILPFLVERKRADDVARTLKEGRFWNQVTKMVEWKSQFVAQGLTCQLQYIIEGHPEQYMMKCLDQCQGVGMCGNPTVTQVHNALRDLRCHPDINVQQTENLQDTVIMLASITAELETRVKKGDFDEMVVKEISRHGGNKDQEFFVVDSDDDDVNIIDDFSRDNAEPDFDIMIEETVETTPDFINRKNGTKQETKHVSSNSSRKPQSKTSLSSSTLDTFDPHEEDIVVLDEKPETSLKGRKSSAVSFHELPLEPLVQYHCSRGKQTPPKKRATPSKYYTEGAYIPRLDYRKDEETSQFSKSHTDGAYNPRTNYKNDSKSVPSRESSAQYIPRLNYRNGKDSYQPCSSEGNTDIGNVNKNHGNQEMHDGIGHHPLRDNISASQYRPPTKMFRLSLTASNSGEESCDNCLTNEQPSNSKVWNEKPVHLGTRKNLNLSRDSAISSGDEMYSDISTKTKIDDFINSVKNRHKIDIALSDSDESLPDLSGGNNKSATFTKNKHSTETNQPFNWKGQEVEGHSVYRKGKKMSTNQHQSKVSGKTFSNDSPGKDVDKKKIVVTTEQRQKIHTVKRILPQVPNTLIHSSLDRLGWNVDLTVADLLDS